MSKGLLIPKIIHRVWLGPEMPKQFQDFGASWKYHHPGWEMKLWSDGDMPDAFKDYNGTLAAKSNIIRLMKVEEIGGVYIDCDVECLAPVDSLLTDTEAFCAWEIGGKVCNAVFGAVPHHPWVQRQVSWLQVFSKKNSPWGPALMTEALRSHPDVRVFEKKIFYPFYWNEFPLFPEECPESYAIHHWARSWAPLEPFAL